LFDKEIKLYLNETIIVKRKLLRRVFYYIYFFFLSIIVNIFRFMSKIFKKIFNVNSYIKIYQFTLYILPQKIIENVLYFIDLMIRIFLYIVNTIFYYLYFLLHYVYVFFLEKIIKFFRKLYIPFKQTYDLRKKIKYDVIKKSIVPHQVSKDLCIIFNLDYDLVVRDQKKIVKYVNYMDYSVHNVSFVKNNYFLYLEKYFLVQYTEYSSFNVSYIRVIFFHVCRFYNFFFRKL
jgi:hypothetical protein